MYDIKVLLTKIKGVAGGELIESSVQITMEQVCGPGYSLMPSADGPVCGSYFFCNSLYNFVLIMKNRLRNLI